MRLKLCYLLTTCVATVGLLTPPAIASNNSAKTQEQLTELKLLKVDRGNIRGNDAQKNQNQQKLENLQSFSAASYPNTSQSYQVDSASNLDKNANFLVVMFMTYALISFIILAVWYQNYQNQLEHQEIENERDLIGREQRIEILERIWRIEV